MLKLEDMAKVAGAVVAFALFAAGCDRTPDVGTTASTAATPSVITAVMTDFEQTWDLAWAPSSDLMADFEGALRDNGIWALIPSEAPPTALSLSADVSITRTVPTSRPATNMVLRRADLSVFVSVQGAPVGTQPACETRLDDAGNPAWTTVEIRGATGCSLRVDGAVSFLEWSENGWYLHAEFGPEVDVDELVSWFATWLPVGSG
jgi:hypothetical protein